MSSRSRAELEAVLAADPNDLVTYLLLAWDQGEGAVGKAEELDNGLFPEWRPKKVLDVLL